jgi:glucose-6-phosphate-specific signal transduction histidine kinase
MVIACDDLLVKPTVLIVDDHSGFRSLARALLEAAHASRADVAVRADGKLVTVLVADDGVGGADPSAGSGLKGIADRVEALGGRFRVESPAGGGTRLLAEIPAAARR